MTFLKENYELMKKPPHPKFSTGTLVRGIPYASGYVQYPLIGIVICESERSNWWGDEYTRWYKILAENEKIIEEIEEYICAI
jgi:hypothetical protein